MFPSDWSNFWNISYGILFILYQVVVLIVIIVMIRQNRKPVQTISWLLVLLLIPVAGLIIYIFFGQNLRKVKLFDRKKIRDIDHIKKIGVRQIMDLQQDKIPLSEKVKDKQHIITMLLNNNKSLLTENNEVTVLNDGESTFESIIEELEKAQSFIHISYYIFEEGEIADRIKEVLKRKAAEGVEIRLIYDAVGSWGLSGRFIRELKKAGIKVRSFMPVLFSRFTSKINYRNHRKMVIVDCKTGFLGGINVSDKYIKGNKLGFWRDTHLKLEGEAVSSLNLVFAIDWFFVSGNLLSSQEKYYPVRTMDKRQLVQIVSSGPDSDRSYIQDAYFAAIATARESVFISTPYFLPTESVMQALKTTALSGVDVRIILPRKSDAAIVQFSAMSYVKELLEHDIKIYLYQEGFAHSKVLLVDDVFASVGTANMDYRSFDTNMEVNALVYDEKVTKELKEKFEDDLSKSVQLNIPQWDRRSRTKKVKESFARMLAPLF